VRDTSKKEEKFGPVESLQTEKYFKINTFSLSLLE
jgi:hypothetical protein